MHRHPLMSQLDMQMCQPTFNSVSSGPWSASNPSFECPPNVKFYSLSSQLEDSPWFFKNPHHHIWYQFTSCHGSTKLSNWFVFFSFHCVGVGALRGSYARLVFGWHLRIWLVNNFLWDYAAFQMLTVDLGLFLQITCFILNIIRQLPIIVCVGEATWECEFQKRKEFCCLLISEVSAPLWLHCFWACTKHSCVVCMV